jgi:PAS domain S-box-containing protein
VTQLIPENLAEFDLSRAESIKSILILMDLIPEPAFIYLREKDEIIIANNALFHRTNFNETDFIGKSIQKLLPNITKTDPIAGHGQKTLLYQKDKSLIMVQTRIFTLASEHETLLFVLESEEVFPDNKYFQLGQEKLIGDLQTTIENKREPNVRATLKQVLLKVENLLNSDLCCIYKADGKAPHLLRYLSSNESIATQFPQYLTNKDLLTSHYPAIWTNDRPALTILQKAASTLNFKSLVVVPLSMESVKFGLFISGSKNSKPANNTLALSKLIATYLAGLMEDQIALHNTRNLSQKIKQVVRIQNEIINNLDEGAIILAPDLTIAEINPAAEAILGYANVEALRQDINSILIGSESLGSAFYSAQQGIPTLTSGDLTLNHRNGKSFPAQVMMTPVMSNDKLLSIILLIRDLSQQEQSQAINKQLEQRALLGEVTAIFAHEVRNPINAIMLALQVIEDNLADDDENHKWILNIRDECNKLLYLMDSVLSFAKPIEYKMSGVDLDFLISRLLERWRPRLLRLNITPYYRSEIINPIIQGDLRAIEQVFTNIISNAVNAMSEKGGSLGIKISEAKRTEDHCFYQITVTDSGHGIPDEIKDHMFKPFVTGTEHGTGLGLAITQRIINAHKGKIEVDSFTGGTIIKIFLVKKKEA